MFREIKQINYYYVAASRKALKGHLGNIEYPCRVTIFYALPHSVKKWVILHEQTHIYLHERGVKEPWWEEIVASIPSIICYPLTTFRVIWWWLKTRWRYKHASPSL